MMEYELSEDSQLTKLQLYTDYLEKNKSEIPNLIKIINNSGNQRLIDLILMTFMKQENYNFFSINTELFIDITKQEYDNKIIYIVVSLDKRVRDDNKIKVILNNIIGVEGINPKSFSYLYSVFDIISATTNMYNLFYEDASQMNINIISDENYLKNLKLEDKAILDYCFYVNYAFSNLMISIYCYASDDKDLGFFFMYDPSIKGNKLIETIYENFYRVYLYFMNTWDLSPLVNGIEGSNSVLPKFLLNLERILDKEFVKLIKLKYFEEPKVIEEKKKTITELCNGSTVFKTTRDTIYSINNNNIDIHFLKEKEEIEERENRTKKKKRDNENNNKNTKRSNNERGQKEKETDIDLSQEEQDEEKEIDLNEKKEKLSQLNPEALKNLLLLKSKDNKLFYYYDSEKINITCIKVIINNATSLELPYIFKNRGASNLKLKINGTLQFIRQQKEIFSEPVSKFILYVGIVKCNKASQINTVLDKAIKNIKASKTVEIKKDMYIIWNYSLDLKFSVNKLSQSINSANNINVSMNEKIFAFYYFLPKDSSGVFGPPMGVNETFKSFGYLKFLFNYTIV